MFRSSLLRFFFSDTSQFLLITWNSFENWLKTRQWIKILLFLIPVLLLAILAAPLLKGFNTDKRTLTSRYAKIASVEVDKPTIETDFRSEAIKSAKNQSGMSLTEIAYRRLLITEPFNRKAKYYVAHVLDKKGQRSQARAIMQELAPLTGLGLPEAHSWLARDLIQKTQRSGTPIPENELIHHLEANASATNPDPELLVLFSSIQEQQGNQIASVTTMERAANASEEYLLNLSLLYQRCVKTDLQKSTAKKAQLYFEKKLKSAELQSDDIIREKTLPQLGLSLALQDDLDNAIRLLSDSLAKATQSLAIRKTLASVYVFRFQKQIERIRHIESLNLSDLESALKLDPENPYTATIISQLLVLQSQQNTELKRLLERNIADGRSSGILHLLLANEAILRKQYTEAIPHLELALSHQPKNSIVLNNLALALVSQSPPETVRASELINEAISLSGETAELLDTKGQILASNNQDLEAIQCFEKAVSLQPSRLSSRKSLVLLYKKRNMTAMATAQENAILLIQEKLQDLTSSQNSKMTSTQAGKIPERCYSPILTSSPPSP